MISDKLYGFVINFEDSAIAWAVRIFAGALLAAFVLAIFAAAQFSGLKSPEAMDQAQLARNIARGSSFSTQCIRPSDFALLSQKDARTALSSSGLPDIRNAPLYPLILSGLFSVAADKIAPYGADSAEKLEKKVIVPFGIFCSVITCVLIFVSARLLFDGFAAVTASTVYIVSASVAGSAISGTCIPLAGLLCMAAFYFALLSIRNLNESTGILRWFIPMMLSGAACGLAVLTSYTMILFVPLLMLYASTQIMRLRPLWLIGLLLIVSFAIGPWVVRNYLLSGSLTGSSFYSVLNNTSRSGDLSFDGNLTPDATGNTIAKTIKAKLARSMSSETLGNLRVIGEGFVICLFLASLFYWHDRVEHDILKWCVFVLAVLACVADAGWSDGGQRISIVFYPFVVILASGYLFALLQRSDFADAGMRMLSVLAFIALTAVPMIMQIAVVRSPGQYPPYYPPFIRHVAEALRPGECVVTDMPWATAWYGDRLSVSLPDDPQSIKDLNAKFGNMVKGVYLTSLTSDKRFISGLVEGRCRGWFPVLSGNVPEYFQLKTAESFPPGKKHQIFISNAGGRPQNKTDGDTRSLPGNQ